MARRAPADHDVVVQLGIAVRKMGAQSVITSRTVADRFALHTTDLEVLDLIFLRKQASAGDLDRLVRAGYVERCADSEDRRRVIVRIREEAIEPIKAAYATMQRRMFDLWSTYSTHDLQLITDFVSKSTALAVECCKSLARRDSASPAGRSPRRSGRRAGKPGARAERSPSPGGTAAGSAPPKGKSR
jgi:hypothetical protein